MMSSGMLRHVALVRTDVSEECISSIITVTRIIVTVVKTSILIYDLWRKYYHWRRMWVPFVTRRDGCDKPGGSITTAPRESSLIYSSWYRSVWDISAAAPDSPLTAYGARFRFSQGPQLRQRSPSARSLSRDLFQGNLDEDESQR
jgi:hypothetical protein